jgi:lysophospholipase L1-like esterase
MKYFLSFLFGALWILTAAAQAGGSRWFPADDPHIQYMGRVDFSNPKLPRFWNPGTIVKLHFSGAGCRIVVHDEVQYGTTHNYVVMLVDNGSLAAYRVKLAGHSDTLTVWGNGKAWMDGKALPSQVRTNLWDQEPDAHGDHVVTICKATEGIGWMEVAGVEAVSLLAPPPLPDRKIEFIGNSITCGYGNDVSGIPCGQGEWYDHHNAWMSYGPQTARALGAQWHLTAVSGIGLIHSCCKMTITMPEVFDRIDNRGNQGDWDYRQYQPDVVTVCLGQNDGIQDSTAFCGAYVSFVAHLRQKYPGARIVLLTSPMGNAALTAVLKKYIGGVIRGFGDARVSSFFFSKQWGKGCEGHPEIREDLEIARELTGYLRGLMGW